ncbi:MAG: hypothetical protein NTY74_12245 [Ignavibacteriae bacterium]|nr:hypothetical protein [Ignavibacteriota bacterium]
MKNILLALIFCVIVLNLSFGQDTITTSQAKDFAGEFKFVKGVVAEVSTIKSGRTDREKSLINQKGLKVSL